MKPILEIQNISKKFRIQHERQSYLNLRDSIANIFNSKNRNSEEFYALKDVSFDVYPGESIGIIGKNGAGKSTLLKILSKITPPTSGKIISRGRIASLLEVGTGFHGELSGRENVFLNGSILGMKRSEIQKNFDAIVDFSGVEKFLDTPLKHYSSGMQLRLAFAVAAFLENEILIIDEVLAVGDAEFQKKCMGKMEDVSRNQGRTVLFVSHNLGAVQNLCSKGVLLKNGEVYTKSDKINKIIALYKSLDYSTSKIEIERNLNRSGSKDAIFTMFYAKNNFDEICDSFFSGEDIYLCFHIKLTKHKLIDLGFSIHDDMDNTVGVLYSSYQKASVVLSDDSIIKCKINLPLGTGRYSVRGRIIADKVEADYPRFSLGYFFIEKGDFYGTGSSGIDGKELLLIKGEWQIPQRLSTEK